METPKKYNLRCNPIMSEKLLHKDFIYDTKTIELRGSTKKTSKKQPRVSKTPMSKAHGSVYMAMSECSVLLKKTEKENHNEMQLEKRVLNFKCNYCNEPIATFMSLSTHVKSHYRRDYCRICFWVLQDNETINDHYNDKHNGKSK